ncbi:vWA domain-containing protein [Rubripirellula reticaptiva]|uniref:von Willebrand factor type A domain protein n=1 Tax=Rubripirellula reticaptiva TaxID=2528013 RepID=A0A5C6F9A0_9BACT|nr:vWA domain-containing protein [Rubripirellula reticaptiva]TWU56279.1 von Willebrand factor type A domain protein [Rubripirellula reticaptiva]
MTFPIQNADTAISNRRILAIETPTLGAGPRVGFKLLLCLIAMIIVCACFVASVLSRPARTPILTLTGVYGPEWDLNAWVAEDLDTIGTLGQGTFSVRELPSIDQIAGGFWDETNDAIRAALQACPKERPLTFYVNLHGAVDDEGRACWIPPNALVTDASTWFPINDFLDHVAQLQSENEFRPIVLLLECGRLRAHWPAGISDNDFDDQLGGVLASHHRNYPQSRVTILSSAARRQRSLYSRLGDGDVFTRYVADGLSGAADGYGTNQKADGYVDTDELHRFVRQQVDGWAVQHRSLSQTPTLHRAGASQPIEIARVSRQQRRESTKTPAPSKEDLKRLRSAIDSAVAMRDLHPISVDAHAWSQIQRTMHSIGQSVYGGKSVRDSSDRWYSRLEHQLQSLRQKIAMRASESSHWVDIEMNRSAHQIWSAIAKQPTHRTAADMIRELAPDKIVPVPMLYALLHGDEDKIVASGGTESKFWRRTDLIRRLASAQASWLDTTLSLPDGVFPAADQIASPVHNSRRHLADTILANVSPLGDALADDSKTGESTSIDSVVQSLDQFESSVKTARAALSELVLAWETRDQAFLELPYLIQVIDEVTATLHSHLADTDESTGMDDVMRLDTLLNQFTDQKQPWTPTSSDQIAIATKRSREFLEHMSGARESTLMSMHDTPAKGSSGSMGARAGTLSSANRCGLIASDPFQQMRIEERLRQLDGELAHKPLPSLVSNHDQVDEHTVHVTPDSLGIMLGLDPDDTNASEVRRQLRSLTSTHSQTLTNRHKARRAVSIIVNEQFSGVIDAAQKAERQSRLASRIDETLDDFWYAPSTSGSAYFDVTAQALLSLAGTDAIETPTWKTTKRAVNEKLILRRLASANGLVIQAKSTPSFIERQKQSISVSLDPSAGQGQLPGGTAVLSIRQPDGVTSLSDQPIVIRDSGPTTSPSKSAISELTLTTMQSSDSVAEVNFRGNRYQSSVMSSGTAFGVASRGQSRETGAEITIRDAMDAGRAVTFILDCSASMNESVDGELGRSTPGSRSANKFDAARSALYEMMRRMQPSGSQVGLVLYGHRMAVAADQRFSENDGLLLQKRYHKRFPFSPTIRPFEDVEVALPTGRFDIVELELARQHLDAAVPWGQTPLYLAISKAINDISRAGHGVTKDIIVISDGRNYQFNPTAETVFTLGQLVSQATEHGVRIHVIGFGLPTAEAATAAIEFETLASGSGGESVIDVKNATELLRRMEQLSSSQTFQIQLPDGTKREGKFSETIKLPEIANVNSPILVSIGGVSTTIAVSPGDCLELLANQMQHRLSTPPYLAGAPVFRPLATAEDHAVSTRVGVETPTLEKKDCRFRLSLQRGDQQVSDRPASMWVEIVPKSREPIANQVATDQVAYRTSQFQWLPKMPCPVAEFSCQDWPANATGYQMQVWCAAKSPTSDLVTIDAESSEGKSRDLKGIDGVTYRIERTADEIQIGFEYAGTDSVDLDAMLVVNVNGVPLASADHWYDDGGKRSFHVFRLADTSGTVHLELETISNIKKRSVHTVRPIQGTMLPSVATLQATTPGGIRK